ncbi:MAG: sulfurtransferase [Bacteroidota bacterium]
MKSLTFLILITVVHTVLFAGPSDTHKPLVTPQWLAERLNDPTVVILNVAQNRRDYLKEHIPGARFLWPGWMAIANPELNFELVPLAQLDTLLDGLGISNSSTVVLYGVAGNVSPTARMYITMEYLGMGDRTYVLDGGLEAWKAEGRSVTKELPVYQRASFTPQVKPDVLVNADFVQQRLNASGKTIIDARAPQFYGGNGGGYPRAGRIPGAVNIYFTTLIDSTNKYVSLDSMKTRFDQAGIKPGDDVTAYCHVGQTASTVYLAAKQLGYNVHLYDGSFEDWSGREDLPVFVPAKPDSLTR